MINVIVERSSGDRKNLYNELNNKSLNSIKNNKIIKVKNNIEEEEEQEQDEETEKLKEKSTTSVAKLAGDLEPKNFKLTPNINNCSSAVQCMYLDDHLNRAVRVGS